MATPKRQNCNDNEVQSFVFVSNNVLINVGLVGRYVKYAEKKKQ